MKKRLLSLLMIFVLLFALAPALSAQAAGGTVEGDHFVFTDRNGETIRSPLNAFPIRVVQFTPGDPWTNVEKNMDPQIAIGLPDATDASSSAGDLCLGKGGVLVLEFEVAIFDGEGNDIYVFEVGPAVEATKVEVSDDLVTWIDVGIAEGRTAGVDLNGKVPTGATFRYVRLTDQGSGGGGSWPGADIDTVSGLNTRAIEAPVPQQPADPVPSTPPDLVTSDWARNEVEEAQRMNLIPDVLIGQDLTQPINRLEFAAVAVKVYENLSGVSALPSTYNPFKDTADLEILKAYNIGAVNGKSLDMYAPYDLLEREQCAAMLTRVFKRVTMPDWTLANDGAFPLTFTWPQAFADDVFISGYARESVYFMTANGIIQGMGNNIFAPRNTTPADEAMRYANATRQQALLIAVRMAKNLK